jgi:hypothetical protein
VNAEQIAKMTLGQKQELFMELLPMLINRIHDSGYQVRGGELERGRAQAAANQIHGTGIMNSLHIIRLAIDLHLFKNGKYLTMSDDHRPFGNYWKTLHPLCRWGGDFTRPDGNHYSISHEGRA